jgi:hypothetical protein
MPIALSMSGSSASRASVVMPTVIRAARWSRRIPATRLRSSLARSSSGAAGRPGALVAVADGHRPGGRDSGDEGLQIPARPTGVGRDVDQLARAQHAIARDDADPIGLAALQHGEAVGVRGHLQQRWHLDPPGELGIGDLVGPTAELLGRREGLEQEVGPGRPGCRRKAWPGR